ncbi:MAG: DUF4367 domain-containing protein [Gracilibacteraceae bacterium]|nr:DUF4367 domain-containing protein [Gracilibacteraceae bacterium]
MPDREKRLNEAYFEAMLKTALREIAEQRTRELEAELDKLPSVPISPGFRKKMDQLFRPRRNFLRKRICAGLAAVILLFGGAMSVEAARTQVLKYLQSIGIGFVKLDATQSDPVSQELMVYIPAYLPEGYSTRQVNDSVPGMVMSEYKNSDGNVIQLTQFNSAKPSISVDTDRHKLREILISGNEALLFETTAEGGNNILIWGNGLYSFYLSGNADAAELEKIAESVRPQ